VFPSHVPLSILELITLDPYTYVKEFHKVSGERVERKVWVCLFTCFIVRAIHIKLVEDMSAEEFLLYLCQFVARKGDSQIDCLRQC